jgi:hypothetical protein
MKRFVYFLIIPVLIMACKSKSPQPVSEIQKKINQFAEFTLTSDISDLDSNQRKMLSIFYEVSDIMDELFWEQTYGCKDSAMKLANDEATCKFIHMNYGPWERLKDNAPFINGIGPKPAGAQFYPKDMTKAEFDSWKSDNKSSLYTIIKRDSAGKLIAIPYHIVYKEKLERAAELLRQAAQLSEDKEFKKYLELRADALITDDYFPSDIAWMDMKSNRIDFVVGPIESYEDGIYGNKASFEAYILLKDMNWSKQLQRFATLMPALQKSLPVENKYKSEVPGSSSDLGAYDVVYYAGDCNSGGKTIAINLPNDPKVQELKGSRRLQLKNSMQAKFDKMMIPIAKVIIDSTQLGYLNFDSFFENTMFHEGAHGIGVHHVVGGDASVQDVLQDQSSSFEEGKADIVGLYIINELIKMGELKTDIKKNYVTFAVGLFRSIRFGASEAHGKANLVCYNYFMQKGAMLRNSQGIYTIDFDKMKLAVDSLSHDILIIQGNGNYQAAIDFNKKYSIVTPELQQDLDRINNSNIPVDITFIQGPEQLGLKAITEKGCKHEKACCEKNKCKDKK